MKAMLFAVVALVATGVVGCDQKAANSAMATGPDLTFEAVITLTPDAFKTLKAADKHIMVVNSHYYGYPAKGATDKANAFGQIELGTDSSAVQVDAPRLEFKFTGQKVNRKLLGDIADGIVYVWLTTRSATPEGFPDELLTCKGFLGTLTKAQSAPVAVTCEPAKPSDAT